MGKRVKMAAGTLKKQPRNLLDSTTVRRNPKKGSSIPKIPKKRSTARLFEVKIRMPMADYIRGRPYFHEDKYLSRYVLDAYLERINRAEANNKRAIAQRLANDIELLVPVLQEMFRQGKLDFLNGKTGGEK
jgi:hypothetical protein